MINRRVFLDYFKKGAIITPLVGGTPLIQAAAALVEIPKVELVSASEDDMPGPLWLGRLEHNAFERVWLARWREEEARYQILEHLLGRDPTVEERKAVAALMQWFGTNCGLGFLHQTFRMEGYYLATRKDNDNHAALSDIHMRDSRTWPEFVTLRMKGSPKIL